MIKKFCDICGKEVTGQLSVIELRNVSDFTNKYYCCSNCYNCYKKLKKMIKDSITK